METFSPASRKGKPQENKGSQQAGPAAQMKISNFFQRKLQFTQKSLSDRNVIASPALGGGPKKRKAEEIDENLTQAETLHVETKNLRNQKRIRMKTRFEAVEAESIETIIEEVQHETVETKKRRIAREEEEEHSGSDTEEDEEIKLEYEEKRRVLMKRPGSQEKEEEKSPVLSPDNKRRLVHANTVSNLSELKRRSPASAKRNSSLLARSPDQARRHCLLPHLNLCIFIIYCSKCSL